MTEAGNSIIVPMEISDQSMIAFEQACNIAIFMKLDVKVVSVDNGSRLKKPFGGMGNKERQIGIRNSLSDLVEKTILNTGLNVELIFKKGKISEIITEVVKQFNSRFVVMSSLSASSGTSNRKIGQNAHLIIRSSPCPVISINGQFHYGGCRSILVPLDLSVDTRQKVTKAIEFALYFKSVIKVISFVSSGIADENLFRLNQQLKQVKRFVEKSNIVCDAELIKIPKGTGSAADHIIDYAKRQNDVDLIMIMIRRDLIMLEYFTGSITQKILKYSEIPVMTILPDEYGTMFIR